MERYLEKNAVGNHEEWGGSNSTGFGYTCEMGQEEFIRRIDEMKEPTIYGALQAAESTRQTVLGAGGQCVVMPHEKGDKVVVAIHYDGLSKRSARLLYYQQRILHTLFPHNFVPYYMTYGAKEGGRSGVSIRARITGKGGTHLTHSPKSPKSITDREYALEMKKEKFNELIEHEHLIQYPLDEAIRAVKEMGFPFAPDIAPVNRMIADDGGEYYVDSDGFYDSVYRLSPKAVLSAMSRRGYGKDAIAIVQKCVEAMKDIEADNQTKH